MNSTSFNRLLKPKEELTYEDGAEYTEAKIENWPYDDYQGLLNFMIQEWDHSYGKIVVGRKWVRFITGGWSDNEWLLSALNRNTLIYALYWESSHRGGLTIYRNPKLID